MDSTISSHASSVQLANIQLVSISHRQPSTFASVQQLEAIGILKDEDDNSIFAWLTLARSLKRGSERASNHP